MDKIIFEEMKTIANQLDKEITDLWKSNMTSTQLKQIIGDKAFNRFELNLKEPFKAVIQRCEPHNLIIDAFSWIDSNEAIEQNSSLYGYTYWQGVNEIYLDHILKGNVTKN